MTTITGHLVYDAKVHRKRCRFPFESVTGGNDASWCCLIVQLDPLERCDIFCFGLPLLRQVNDLRAGTVIEVDTVPNRTRSRSWTAPDGTEWITAQYVASTLRVVEGVRR